MSRIICLLLCVLCAEVAVTQAGSRFRREGGFSSSSSSSSGSYSGAGGSNPVRSGTRSSDTLGSGAVGSGAGIGGIGSSGVGSGGIGSSGVGSGGAAGSGAGSGSAAGSGAGGSGTGGGFSFPNNNFGYSPYGNFGAPPFPDFNVHFQQFLSSLQSAQSYAAHNPNYAAMFQQQLQTLMSQQQAAMAQNPFLFSGVDSNTISPDLRAGNPFGGGGAYTGASVNYGPQGGYGQATSYPGGPDGLGVRIAEEFPAPTGGGYGVFSSSSSGTSDVNGKRTSFKTSTFGTNDNGKITFRTINE